MKFHVTNIWPVIDRYIRDDGLIDHQTGSYDFFVVNTIPETILSLPAINIDNDYYTFQSVYSDVYFHQPSCIDFDGNITNLSPNESRDRNICYSSPLFIKIHKIFTIKTIPPQIIEEDEIVLLAHGIPVMLKSIKCVLKNKNDDELAALGECLRDPGGYFIINGNEKVVVAQERMAYNQTYVYEPKRDEDHHIEISSCEEKSRKPPGNLYIHLCPVNNLMKHTLRVHCNYLKREIPLTILIKAYGITNNNEIAKKLMYYCDENNKLMQHEINAVIEATIEEGFSVSTQEEALIYIAKHGTTLPESDEQKLEFSRIIIEKEALRHIGMNNFFNHEKGNFLMYMTRKLFATYCKERAYDDHDHYKNKRIDVTGTLMANIFRQSFTRIHKELQIILVKKLKHGNVKDVALKQMIDPDMITKDLTYALATGNWGTTRNKNSRTGVSQVLNRFNYLSTYSHLRRIANQVSKNSVTAKPRQLHNSSFGIICCCVTGDTNVTLADGTKKEIKDLNQDTDVVLTINPDNLQSAPSKIYNFFSRMAKKNELLQIETISGRKLKCTTDHPLLVKRIIDTPEHKRDQYFIEAGYTLFEHKWVDAGDLKVNDIIIVSHRPELLNGKGDKDMIIDSNLIKWEYGRKQLIKMGLVDKKLPISIQEILARILGFLWSGGHCGIIKNTDKYTAHFFLGCIEDGEDLMTDIIKLGFTKTSIIYKVREDFDGVNIRIFLIQREGAFASLMVALGVHIGRKTESNSPEIPQWIMNGSLSVKREFLSGFQGGDGGRIYVSHERFGKDTVKINATRLETHPEHLTAKIKFMAQYSELLKEFGIESHVSHTKAYITDKNNLRCTVNVNIGVSRENLIQYADKIWYRYSREKSYASAFALEYLKTKKEFIKEKELLYMRIFEEFQLGKKTKAQLGREFNIDQRRVGEVIKYKGTRPANGQDLCIKQFVDSRTLTDCVYTPIKSIKTIKSELVYDFTTFSDNHSFLANDIVTHQCETPEGSPVGLVKNMALTAGISLAFSDVIIRELIDRWKIKSGKGMLLINGRIIRENVELSELYQRLRSEKHTGGVPYDTGIVWTPAVDELQVFTDASRGYHPLFVCDLIDNKPQLRFTMEHFHKIKNGQMSFNDLITNGIVELLDAGELETLLVCMRIQDLHKTGFKYTHVEMHPVIMMGILASNVPFAHYDPATRVAYQSAQGKQSIGRPHLNQANRMDTISHDAWYPHQSICRSKIMLSVEYEDVPSGQMCVIAIGTFLGQNIEDSLIFSKSAIDMGLGRSTVFHVYEAKEVKTTGYEEKFGRPDDKNAHKLDWENGVVSPGTYVQFGDMLIGIISNNPKVKPRCIYLKNGDDGVVDKVIISTNNKGIRNVMVRVRSVRIPQLGDKYSAPHGQKGTIGMIANHEDLPFTGEGITPNIMINTHALTSRMTVGMVIELVAGKGAVMRGGYGNSTPFEQYGTTEICQALKNVGYQPRGKEIMYDGTTGEQLDAMIFIGPVYIQRLKHMVVDKIHSRATGPIQALMRQPLEGRARDGGLRFGLIILAEVEKRFVLLMVMNRKFCLSVYSGRHL